MKLFPTKYHEQATLRKLHCMTSNRKQFNITYEMLTAVTRDQGWPDVVAGVSACFSNLYLFVLLYNKSLNDWSLEEQ